jgi:iron complex outermembrane receptor protein
VARGRLEGVRGTNLTSHEPLPLLPPVRGTVGIGWRDRLGMDVDMYARPKRLNPLDIPTAGYALLHFSIGADRRMFGRNVRGVVSLRNALNQRYKSFLSRYKEFAFDPGRNLIIRLSTGFSTP